MLCESRAPGKNARGIRCQGESKAACEEQTCLKEKSGLLLAVVTFDFAIDFFHADDLSVTGPRNQAGLLDLPGLGVCDCDSVYLQRATKRAFVIGFRLDEIG